MTVFKINTKKYKKTEKRKIFINKMKPELNSFQYSKKIKPEKTKFLNSVKETMAEVSFLFSLFIYLF
jgi:hypothetical protein